MSSGSRSAGRFLAALAVVALATPALPATREQRGGILLTTGISQQSDAVVAGLGGAWRYWFVGADLGAHAGMGVDFWILRPSLHAIAQARVDDFRLYALLGPSFLVYRTRGPYAEFCEKARLDCDTVVFGLDVGAGVGWNWIGAEAYFGTGELPLLTAVAKATWLF